MVEPFFLPGDKQYSDPIGQRAVAATHHAWGQSFCLRLAFYQTLQVRFSKPPQNVERHEKNLVIHNHRFGPCGL